MCLAMAISKRSTCNVPNRSVGCIIVSSDNSRCLSLGYNGGAAGSSKECEYDGTLATKIGSSRCNCVHAEMNALAKLNSNDSSKKICYLTLSPCPLCARLLVNANISEVIFKQRYEKGDGLDILIEAGIKIYQYDADFDKKIAVTT